MIFHSLTGEWQFRQTLTDRWLPAKVPGSVHLDLMALDLIPDPGYGDNEIKVQWVAETDWEYFREFEIDADLLTCQQVFLVCEGLDTLAEIFLNERLLGKTDNMFRHYRWDVKPYLHEGSNRILVRFTSPVNYITEQLGKRYLICGSQSIEGGTYLRKAACHFGWDWGPKLPAIGIWKDIRLEGRNTARLVDIHIRQRHQDGVVSLDAHLSVDRWQETALTAVVRLTAPDATSQEVSSTIADKDQVLRMDVQKPQLWWPNGYGAQPLYQVEVELWSGQRLVDKRIYKIGLRTIELRQEADAWGKSFTFVVNQVPIFAKGSNWIPAETFFTRITDLSLDHFLKSAALAHQNMLRVWGGGYYEDDRFYELCDRYGILVWQDFMFACGIYPLDDEMFTANVRQEVVEAIHHLRNHACLALWCGNNEMEQGWTTWGWDLPVWQSLKQQFEKFFYQTLAEIVAEEDPDTAYWPGSPSSGVPFENPNGEFQGDAHYWDVWHGRKPFSAYKDQYPRFMSEFGFQSLPPLETIQTCTPADEWNLTSYIMEHHQRSPQGNALIVAQMGEHYRMPKDFSAWVYMSMVLQAEGIRSGVEHWRRNKHRVSGTLYWQLNDCWPVVSWSSIDYYGRWKALHYAARRFYAPVLVSIDQENTQIGVHLTSDLPAGWQGDLEWSLETLDGNILDTGKATVSLDPLQTTRVLRLDFSALLTPDNVRRVIFFARLCQGEEVIGQALAAFVPDKHLILEDPEIQIDGKVVGDQVQFTLTARSLARFVELKIPGFDLVFSDNYFDLPAEMPRLLSCPNIPGWSFEKFQHNLVIRSLVDSF